MDRLASINAEKEGLKYLNDIDVPIENWKYEALYGKRFMTVLPSKTKSASVEYHLFFQDGAEHSREELYASLSDKNSTFGIPVTSFQPFGNLMFVAKNDKAANRRSELFHLALPWISVLVILLVFFLAIFFIFSS